MSEALMMGLGRHIGREYAHDLVYELCRQSLKTGVPLIELAAKHPRSPATSTARRWNE